MIEVIIGLVVLVFYWRCHSVYKLRKDAFAFVKSETRYPHIGIERQQWYDSLPSLAHMVFVPLPVHKFIRGDEKVVGDFWWWRNVLKDE